MRKLVSVSLLAAALLVIPAAPSLAWSGHHGHFGTRVIVGVGPGFWWGGWGPYPYPYYYPYYYTPPPVVVQEPPVYVQQQPELTPTPAPAPPSSSSTEGYWYYCASSRDYYPNVPSCSEAWIKVPPRQQ